MVPGRVREHASCKHAEAERGVGERSPCVPSGLTVGNPSESNPGGHVGGKAVGWPQTIATPATTIKCIMRLPR